MKYLKKYKVFESIENNLIMDLNDIFLEFKDDGYDVKALTYNDNIEINLSNINKEIKISEFFNRDEFKRAYYYLLDKGYIKHYLIIYSNGLVINMPSALYQEDTPWEEFSSDNRKIDSISIEFHIPNNLWHIIFIPSEDPSDWDVYRSDLTSREEAFRIKSEAPIFKDPYGNMVKGRLEVISDNSYWDRER
jgi:hypothetical protein